MSMMQTIETLVARFENGRLDRRDLLSALAALCGATQVSGAQQKVRPATINHVTLSVANLERSRAFFQGILQTEILGSVNEETDLSLGTGFVALMKTNRRVGIDHFCIGVEGYDPNRIGAALEAQGHKPRILTEALGSDSVSRSFTYVTLMGYRYNSPAHSIAGRCPLRSSPAGCLSDWLWFRAVSALNGLDPTAGIEPATC